MTTRSGRTVWLASYPKSGNTWLRAILTALGTHQHLFGVDHLGHGAQPHHVGAALSVYGLDPRYLNAEEIDQLRTELILSADMQAPDGPPLIRKTHERYRPRASSTEPFPASATRAAILLCRDPRDVACSYSAFFGVTIDRAIDALGRDGGDAFPSPARMQSAQPWGTWSSHAESWLDAEVPFPVHVVRYEDLLDNANAALMPVFTAIGVTCSRVDLQAAVEASSFDRLKVSEAERGFRETSRQTDTFFRRGITGGWRGELTFEQISRIERDHATVMGLLGYERLTGLHALQAARTTPDWLTLPASLDLNVREGFVPNHLAQEQRPRPWLEANETAALVRFRGGAGVLVERGSTITVDRGSAESDQVGWIVQGWGVSLAMLQRGLLSLHASTVDVAGTIVAIAGDRGAGKSTTSMGLRGRGHRLLCDDVTVVELRNDGAWTTPYWRNVHLLEDSADALDVDFGALPALGSGRIKGAFRPEEPPDEPRRIERIVILTPESDSESVTLSRPSGAARMQSLLDHTVRDGVAPIVLGQERYFAQVAQLADIVPITIVSRPREGWTLDAVLDAIEADATGSTT